MSSSALSPELADMLERLVAERVEAAVEARLGPLQAALDTLSRRLADHDSAADGASLLVFSGDLDRLLAAFIVATSAAAMGLKVHLSLLTTDASMSPPNSPLERLELENAALRIERDALADANVRAAELMAELAEAHALEDELRLQAEEQRIRLSLAQTIAEPLAPEALLAAALAVFAGPAPGAAYLRDTTGVLRRCAGDGPDELVVAAPPTSSTELDGDLATLWLCGHERCLGALRLRCPSDGRDRWLRLRSALAAQLGVALDRSRIAQTNATITAELIDARDRAERANRAKSRFLASVSHELRTPLNAIVGYTELLQDLCEEHGDDLYLTDLRRIRVASDHLLGLVEDLLDLSQIEADKAVLVPVRTPLRPLFLELEMLAAPLAAARGNRLVLAVDAAPADMFVDPRRLRQTLLNLLDNACKYTDQGEVSLHATADGDRVVFSVRDTGIGIAPNQHARIFELFVRADDPAVRRRTGSGLGLALIYRLVAQMGGTLTVASELGQGSNFSFSLPREPA